LSSSGVYGVNHLLFDYPYGVIIKIQRAILDSFSPITNVLGRATNKQFWILYGDCTAEQKELSAARP